MNGTIPSSGAKKIVCGSILWGLALITGTMRYMIIKGWHLFNALSISLSSQLLQLL